LNIIAPLSDKLAQLVFGEIKTILLAATGNDKDVFKKYSGHTWRSTAYNVSVAHEDFYLL